MRWTLRGSWHLAHAHEGSRRSRRTVADGRLDGGEEGYLLVSGEVMPVDGDHVMGKFHIFINSSSSLTYSMLEPSRTLAQWHKVNKEVPGFSLLNPGAPRCV